MHGNSHILGLVFPFHLFFNLLFFFAVGFTLEDLWGRGGFLAFYLSSAAAAAIPDLVGSPVAMIGASGAVSATMGAFLVRLPTTKIKVGWLVDPLAFPVLFLRIMFHKKPWGIVKVKGYYFLLYYFTSQLLFWWFINHKLGMSDGTSYKCHIAGFIFGGVFAFFMKAGQIEERYINPKIEAKVSFEGSPAVTRALEMLDRGQAELAERKLKAEFARNPNDPNTMMALIQVYQRGLNYEQLNAMYGRLIRYYLQNHDKEAALYAYDSLLSSFPDDDLRVQIPLRDWLSICEYLREAGMNREAGVEYERLVNAYPNDSLSVHACVLGGEAALAAHDNSRALRLFEKAEALGPGDGDASRVMKGLDKCRMRLDNRPTWVKQPTQSQGLSKDRDQKDLRF
jgi:membrane associated rhomboid family serine protease